MTNLFPETIVQWRCPSCGKRVMGSYDLDEGRKKCTKRIHRAAPVRQTYIREDKCR